MHVPLWLKVAWTLWLLVWAPVYWHQYGAQNFLFFCDIGNVLIGIGLWLECPLIAAVSDALLRRSCRCLAAGPAHHRRDGVHVRSRPAACNSSIEPVSCGGAAAVVVGDLASRLRPARMETADADRVDRSPNQLFLASANGCELGAWPVLSRATCSAGIRLSRVLLSRRASAGLFPDALVAGVGV